MNHIALAAIFDGRIEDTIINTQVRAPRAFQSQLHAIADAVEGWEQKFASEVPTPAVRRFVLF